MTQDQGRWPHWKMHATWLFVLPGIVGIASAGFLVLGLRCVTFD